VLLKPSCPCIPPEVLGEGPEAEVPDEALGAVFDEFGVGEADNDFLTESDKIPALSIVSGLMPNANGC
jgi:hypothetical protein